MRGRVLKIFLDTEFYEFQPKAMRTIWSVDPAEPYLGQQPSMGLVPLSGANAVQLISIGAVREDGEEFYAENSLFDWSVVPDDHWLQGNVRPYLFPHKSTPSKTRICPPDQIAWEFRRFANAEFINPSDKPEFWVWYGDYDWVVLCGLYGRMVDLPREFPMYARDIKQLHDDLHDRGYDVPRVPKPEHAHNALADARWNKQMYERLVANQLDISAGRAR